MTTIACKDGVMACDSLQRGCYIDQMSVKKIIKISRTGEIVGVSGNRSSMALFMHWLTSLNSDHEKWPSALHNDFSAIILNPDGDIAYYSADIGIGISVGKIAAIGSGQEFAMGAMLSGASAQDAVLVACKLDPESSEPIFYEKIDKI